MTRKTYILFVCPDNSFLSQMAEAMVRLYRDDEIVAYSAGIQPNRHISPKAVDLMARIGYNDLHLHTTKGVKDVPDFNYDFIITLGLPAYIGDISADKRLEWRFNEVDADDETQLLRLRDKLLNRVLNLVISVAV